MFLIRKPALALGYRDVEKDEMARRMIETARGGGHQREDIVLAAKCSQAKISKQKLGKQWQHQAKPCVTSWQAFFLSFFHLYNPLPRAFTRGKLMVVVDELWMGGRVHLCSGRSIAFEVVAAPRGRRATSSLGSVMPRA